MLNEPPTSPQAAKQCTMLPDEVDYYRFSEEGLKKRGYLVNCVEITSVNIMIFFRMI